MHEKLFKHLEMSNSRNSDSFTWRNVNGSWSFRTWNARCASSAGQLSRLGNLYGFLFLSPTLGRVELIGLEAKRSEPKTFCALLGNWSRDFGGVEIFVIKHLQTIQKTEPTVTHKHARKVTSLNCSCAIFFTRFSYQFKTENLWLNF